MAFLFPKHSLPAVKVVHLNYYWIASCLPTAGFFSFFFNFYLFKFARKKMVGAASRCRAPSVVTALNSHFPLACLSALLKPNWDKPPLGAHIWNSPPFSNATPSTQSEEPTSWRPSRAHAGRFTAGGASDGSPKGRHKLGLHLDQHLSCSSTSFGGNEQRILQHRNNTDQSRCTSTWSRREPAQVSKQPHTCSSAPLRIPFPLPGTWQTPLGRRTS